MPDRVSFALPALFALALSIAACRDQTSENYPALSGTFKEQWRYTPSIVADSNNCNFNEPGTIYVSEDNRLIVVHQGMSYPNFIVPLDPDGGANKTVGLYDHPNQLLRVTVAPGKGPRKVAYLSELTMCSVQLNND